MERVAKYDRSVEEWTNRLRAAIGIAYKSRRRDWRDEVRASLLSCSVTRAKRVETERKQRRSLQGLQTATR